MRRCVVVVLALASCSPEDNEPALLPSLTKRGRPIEQLAPAVDATAKPAPWTFAVMSDLHLPNDHAPTVHKTVAALVELRVRFVVITGDHTNGSGLDGAGLVHHSTGWWEAVTTALQPLRDAGIAVLPVAGNHDSYLAEQRDRYAGAFADLDGWAGSLAIKTAGGTGRSLARAPFSYSVEVDGVHLTLAHIVAQGLDREVAAWLAEDLAAAAGARHRIVFGHLPLSSVIQPPSHTFAARLGAILERGHAGLYVAGHEHIVWDEDVALPAGGSLRQVLVGCTSGYYDYQPSEPSKQRAGCVPIELAGKREPMRCKMPNGGGEFVLSRGRKNRHIQHYKSTFTLFTVDGDKLSVRPMTIDANGRALPFYLNE